MQSIYTRVFYMVGVANPHVMARIHLISGQCQTLTNQKPLLRDKYKYSGNDQKVLLHCTSTILLPGTTLYHLFLCFLVCLSRFSLFPFIYFRFPTYFWLMLSDVITWPVVSVAFFLISFHFNNNVFWCLSLSTKYAMVIVFRIKTVWVTVKPSIFG